MCNFYSLSTWVKLASCRFFVQLLFTQHLGNISILSFFLQLLFNQHLGYISILPFFCSTSIFTQHMGNISMLLIFVYRFTHIVHTEWQRPLSGVHPIMMEKLARAGEAGGCTATSFHCIYHHVQSCSIRFSGEGRCTLPISYLPLCTLWFYPSAHALSASFQLCNFKLVGTWVLVASY